jgi:L-iditol 2-dehydrogenase
VKRLTGGEGPDVVIVANPAPAAVEQAVTLAAKGGRISLFGGLPQTNSRVSVDGNLIHYRELTLSGAFGASRRHNALALDLLARGAVPADRIITHTVPLPEIVAGLELLKSGQALKVAVDTTA